MRRHDKILNPPPSPRARREAVEWLMRTERDDADPQVWLDFSAWIEASPDNARAIRKLDGLSADLSLIADDAADG